MSTCKKPAWGALFIIGLGSAALLFAESRLPVGAEAHTWLLVGWVALFYGALAVWTRRNSEALESEPPALDCTGRPITNNKPPATKARPQNRIFKPGAESRHLGYKHSEAN